MFSLCNKLILLFNSFCSVLWLIFIKFGIVHNSRQNRQEGKVKMLINQYFDACIRFYKSPEYTIN